MSNNQSGRDGGGRRRGMVRRISGRWVATPFMAHLPLLPPLTQRNAAGCAPRTWHTLYTKRITSRRFSTQRTAARAQYARAPRSTSKAGRTTPYHLNGAIT